MKKLFLITIISLSFCLNSFSNNKISDIFVSTNGESCSPLNAHFYFTVDTFKTGSYRWDFGDGLYSYSNGNYCNHTYSIPGTYTVTFTGIIGTDTSIIIKQNFIKVFKAPKALFSISKPDSVYAPYEAKFINNTTPGDGDSLFYSWNFKDTVGGSFSELKNPVHTFNIPGSYNISLNVKDNNGCSSEYSFMLFVKDSAQKHEIKYISGGCLGKKNNKSIVHVEYYIYKDTLKLSGQLYANCCGEKTIVINKTKDTVFIKQFETGGLCTCGCYFLFSINVPGIPDDSVYVVFDGNTYLAKKSLYYDIKLNKTTNILNIIENPVTDFISIDLNGQIQEKTNAALYNVLGKLFYEGEITESNNKINTTAFNNGIYILRITTPNTSQTQKIIIKH